LIAAIVLLIWDLPFLDPALSLGISAYILWNVWKRLRETIYIFLQGIPRDIEIEQLMMAIRSIKGVQDMHHTHVWSLDGEHHVFTTHMRLEENVDLSQLSFIKKEFQTLLAPYHFTHSTLEIEAYDEICRLEVANASHSCSH